MGGFAANFRARVVDDTTSSGSNASSTWHESLARMDRPITENRNADISMVEIKEKDRVDDSRNDPLNVVIGVLMDHVEKVVGGKTIRKSYEYAGRNIKFYGDGSLGEIKITEWDKRKSSANLVVIEMSGSTIEKIDSKNRNVIKRDISIYESHQLGGNVIKKFIQSMISRYK